MDGIVRKTDNRLHSTERIKGAVLYTLEDARSKSGHLFLPSEDLVKETLLLLNAPIPIPEQRVRTEEVQETLQQMILHGAVVAYKQYLYSPRVFGQEDDTARMIAERLANISVAENIESALESVRESLGITLSQKQEQAVRTAFQHGLTIITGSPGTGKTTVLKAIIEVFKNLHMDSQLPDYMQLKRAFLYRSPMEEAISTYSDYLQMCQEQNYDMKSSQVLFPKHCNEAHDELSRYIKKCRDEQTKRAFREVYEHLAEKANLTSKKLQIVCPKQTDDLIAEGQALHHCVGTYIERVAAKKCLIVFVRRVEEPKKPYVTVEVRNGKIEQIHGDHNSDPTEEVKKFVDLWSRKVLPMALQAA